MSYHLTIPENRAMPAYGLNTTRAFTIYSFKPIAEEEVGKIQKIAGAWLELIYAREAFTLPSPPSKNRIEKFSDYVLNKPLDRWNEEAEYSLFLSAIKRLTRAEEAYQKVLREYRVSSIRFGVDERDSCWYTQRD